MSIDKFIYLNRSEVDACGVTLQRSLEISEETYSEHAKGNYEKEMGQAALKKEAEIILNLYGGF